MQNNLINSSHQVQCLQNSCRNGNPLWSIGIASTSLAHQRQRQRQQNLRLKTSAFNVFTELIKPNVHVHVAYMMISVLIILSSTEHKSWNFLEVACDLTVHVKISCEETHGCVPCAQAISKKMKIENQIPFVFPSPTNMYSTTVYATEWLTDRQTDREVIVSHFMAHSTFSFYEHF